MTSKSEMHEPTLSTIYLPESLTLARAVALREMSVGQDRKRPVINIAETREQVRVANDIINRRYALKGYGANHAIPFSANHITFNAQIDGEVVGTITLAIDSPKGLASDRTFKPEMNKLRDISGVKLCELTKFAFSSTLNSKQLMAQMFHIVFVYGQRTHQCTDRLIEVNARHVRFYEAMLGFRQASPPRINKSVGAPLKLMQLKVTEIRDNINRYAGTATAGAHLLYPLFLSPADEDGIFERLRRATPITCRDARNSSAKNRGCALFALPN